jgi:type IV secretory pathway protease TraF
MIPEFAPGEWVLVRYNTKFEIGDVVLIDFKERIDIKRVTKIISDQVFVQGDNSEVSIDSRQYGAVRKDRIVGKVIYRLPRWLIR